MLQIHLIFNAHRTDSFQFTVVNLITRHNKILLTLDLTAKPYWENRALSNKNFNLKSLSNIFINHVYITGIRIINTLQMGNSTLSNHV